jgi:hypothetical protein
MVKTKLNIQKTTEIVPPSSFIERITILGQNVTIKMKSGPTLYHFELENELLRDLIASAKNEESMGTFFNTKLRHRPHTKAVAVKEPTEND